jgi:hypothetical protein
MDIMQQDEPQGDRKILGFALPSLTLKEYFKSMGIVLIFVES